MKDMSIVKNILLSSAEIITITVGVAGLILSLAILVSPAAVGRISGKLNRQFNFGNRYEQLNRQVSVERVLGWVPFLSGSLIAGGSLAVLAFLCFSPMPQYTGRVMLAIGFESLVLLARLASVLGFVFGCMLMFAPDALKRINDKLNRWHDADAVVHRMEQYTIDFDGWILNNPRASGVIGLIMSVVLLVVSIAHW